MGLKGVVLSSFSRMDMLVLVMQDMIKEVSFGGKLKRLRVSLMNGHSILSKVFSRSILRIMLPTFPFILEK